MNQEISEQSTDITTHKVSDNALLISAFLSWQFADWVGLCNLGFQSLEKHPDKSLLLLLSSAAHLQLGDTQTAEVLIEKAQMSGCGRELILEILISGVHNTLGMGFAIDGQEDKSSKHFMKSIAMAPIKTDTKFAFKARSTTELARLGMPVLGELTSGPSSPICIDFLLNQALDCAPREPGLLIAAAEMAQRKGHHQDAIRLWQRLAAKEGVNMPQAYYERLKDAYLNVGSFPLGSVEEEMLRGDGDKHEMLKKIHFLFKPSNYLEIGIQSGKSLFLASCPTIGVDPMPQINKPLGSNIKIFSITSDEFFSSRAAQILEEPLGLVFIDGMHLFEYVLRDFINVEKYADKNTIVVIDDIFPGHPIQAERDRRTRAWTGDVWKLLVTLQQKRPELKLLMLDAFPTGLLCISGLDRDNNILQNAYDQILNSFDVDSVPPADILNRNASVSCQSNALEHFITKLNSVRVGINS